MLEQCRVIRIISAAMLCACGGCGALGLPLPGVGNVPASLVLPGDDAEVPFLFHAGYVVVDVKINGMGPHKFLIDTGASVSVISSRISGNLPQNIVGTTSIVSNVDPNTLSTSFILIDRLEMGPIAFERLQAAILSAITITSNDQRIVVDGILGAPLFRNVALTVDYPMQSVRIRNSASPPVNQCKVFATSPGPADLPTINLVVAGRQTQAIIDTGNNEFLLLPAEFSTLSFIGPTQPSTAATVTGVLATIVGRLNGVVQSGCLSFDQPTLTIGGNISSMGSKAFSDSSITLDQASNLFWLQGSAQ